LTQNEIANDFATNVAFVDTSTLLELFDQTPESLVTNASQALQTPMPSSKAQVKKANVYLSHINERKEAEHKDEDLQYYVDNYPFKLEDPDFLTFIEDLSPLEQIEVLRARTKNIIGMAVGDKFIAHPYTRAMFEENFTVALESFKVKDPADAVERLAQSYADRGERGEILSYAGAYVSDLFEEVFDFTAETIGLKHDQSDLDRIHKEITQWLDSGKKTRLGEPSVDLSPEARSVYRSLSKQALEMTKETYQLEVNSLKTDEERRAFFNEKIRKPIELDNYRFSGMFDPSEAIRKLKSKEGGVSRENQVQRAFNMMKKTKAENPGEFVSSDLNTFLGAENYLYVGDLKSTAEGMVFEKDLPFNVRGGRNILNYIKQENPGLDEKQIVDLFRFDLAGYFEKTGVDPEYAFAFDKSSLLKILDSLGSNNE